MIETLGQTTSKLLDKQSQNYLRFVSQDISIVFIVKVVYNMEMVKIAKLTKIYGGNPNCSLERGLQLLYIHVIRYIQDFYCESYVEVVKITKLIKISNFVIIQKNLTLTTLKNAVVNILGNSRKISILSSTVHKTTTKTSPYVWIMHCCVGLT